MAINKIAGRGFHQIDIITAITEIITDWNLIMVKLDADDLTANDYASVCSMALNTNLTGGLSIDQGDKVTILKDMVTKINACLTKLAADVAKLPFSKGNYAALAVTDNIEVAGGKIYSNGLYKGDFVKLISDIKTAINSMTAVLDTEAGGAGGNVNIDTNYAATYPIEFTIDATGC